MFYGGIQTYECTEEGEGSRKKSQQAYQDDPAEGEYLPQA